VVVTFSLAPEPDAAAALAPVADRQPKATVRKASLLGADVDRLDLVGGTGPDHRAREAAPGRRPGGQRAAGGPGLNR
jgi:hypothetical protein